MFDWPGNSADLIPIEEVWNIMKKNSVKPPKNRRKKKLLNNICNLWYGILRETVKKCRIKCLQWWKLCVRRNVGLSCTEWLKTMV